MRKFLSVLLAMAMVLSLTVTSFAADTAADAKAEMAGKTVILHTNDVHGAVEGYAYIAQLKADYEAKGAEVILVDAGDYSQGEVYVSDTKGLDAVEMMNVTGYDVVTLGNHEFDYGYAQLKENMTKADFKILCANVYGEDGTPIFDANYTYTTKSGVKIGFFGMETPEAQTKANPALIKGLKFDTDLKAVAEKQLEALKDDDVVIALSHLGVDDSSKPYTSYDLYNAAKGIDFIIDGHSHSVMIKGKNGEPIQSTGTKFANIGVIVIDDASKKIESNSLYEIKEDTAKDAAVAAAAQKIIDRIDKEYGAVFAKSKVELNGAKAPNGNRDSETNNGDLITDAMLWKVMQNKEGLTVNEDHVVAITNGGGIRAAIKVGDVTKKDIKTVLPFGNTIEVIYVTGTELLEALEASTFCVPESIGGFPQVSGISYTISTGAVYDANAETYPASTYYGPKTINRVSINSINGKEFKADDTYAVVTNNFVADGGDTYYAFKTASVNYDLGIPMDEVVMDYVKTELKGVVSAENYGEAGDRITIIKGLPFTDVDPSAAYYSAVKYCYENNIFKGVTDTMFMPNNTITRGQMVTVLWRMNGSPEPKNANPFGDVAATSPFVKAIAWAAENKLTNGITETTFAPAQAISRQQFLTILYRYAQFMGYDVSVGEDTNILSFEDVGEVGEYAIPAMQWAVGSGVLAAEKTLTPRAAAPRCNVAEFLANFCMKVIPTAEMMPKAA